MADWQTGWDDHKCLITHLIAELDGYATAPNNRVSAELRKGLRAHLKQAESNADAWSKSADDDAAIKDKLATEQLFFNVFISVLALSSSEFTDEWKQFFNDEVALNEILKTSF